MEEFSKEIKLDYKGILKRLILPLNLDKFYHILDLHYSISSHSISNYNVYYLDLEDETIQIDNEDDFNYLSVYMGKNNLKLLKIYIESKSNSVESENQYKEKSSIFDSRENTYKDFSDSIFMNQSNIPILETNEYTIEEEIKEKTKKQKKQTKNKKETNNHKIIEKEKEKKKKDNKKQASKKSKKESSSERDDSESEKAKSRKKKGKKNNASDENVIETWFLEARRQIRKYKKTEDKNSSYVITYEGKSKIKIQFRVRGEDKKFKCHGKLVQFAKEGYEESWDMETGSKKMENYLNFALENFEDLDRIVYLNKY